MDKKRKLGRPPTKKIAAPEGRPLCPEWLNEDGRAHWERTVHLLQQVPGLLSLLDEDALTSYAEAWQEFHGAMREIEQVGATAISDKGLPYQHPAVGRKNKALERIRHYQRQFGFTPDARKKMKIETRQDETDPFAEFLRRRQNMEGN